MVQKAFPGAVASAENQIHKDWVKAKEEGKITNFKVTNKIYYSTLCLVGTIETINVATGKYAALFSPQNDTCFDYRLGDNDLLRGVNQKMTEAETNMSQPNSPDGSNEMAILALGSTCRAITPTFASAASFPLLSPNSAAQCLLGRGLICDPYGQVAPDICNDPGLLENAIYQYIAPNATLVLDFDHGNNLVSHVGRLSDIPQAGASSFLHAHGEPTFRNRMELGAGFYWRNEASRRGGSKLTGRVTLESQILVPFTAATLPNAGGFYVPNALYAEITVAVMGTEYSPVQE